MSASTVASGCEALLEVLDGIQQTGRGHRFVLIRETALDASSVDAGDVDLLGSRRHVVALLAHLEELCREGGVNLFVERTGPRKTRVSLYSQGLRHAIHLDLWTDLWQLDAGRRSLRWSDVADRCHDGGSGFARMPVALEAAVYVEHLRTKRRDTSAPGVQARLDHYAAALAREAGASDGFARALADLAAMPGAALAPGVLAHASEVLDRELGRRSAWRSGWRRFGDVLRRLWMRRLAPPRGAKAVALVGADGIGKSTLGKALVAEGAGWAEYVLGKSLYRRSLLFRGVYRIARMTRSGLSQERIDEALAGLAYLTAVVRLRRRLAAARGRGLVIDRYLADFLYVGRKADRSRFSRWAWLAEWFDVSLPIVHLTASHAELSTRKQEMSQTGLVRFDRDMTCYYAGRDRVRYLRFVNEGAADEALSALSAYLAPLAGGEDTG